MSLIEFPHLKNADLIRAIKIASSTRELKQSPPSRKVVSTGQINFEIKASWHGVVTATPSPKWQSRPTLWAYLCAYYWDNSDLVLLCSHCNPWLEISGHYVYRAAQCRNKSAPQDLRLERDSLFSAQDPASSSSSSIYFKSGACRRP
jgi:hypothetical protein